MENSLKFFESFLIWSRRSNSSRLLKANNDLINNNISEFNSKQLLDNRLFCTSSSSMMAERKPMIKFLGRRFPQPKFDSSILTSQQQEPSKTSNNKNELFSKAIEFYQLPECYRPKPLSEQEIKIINSGGCIN